MKNVKTLLIASAIFAAGSLYGVGVGLTGTAGQLQTDTGAALPLGTLGLMVVDSNDDGYYGETPGTEIGAGSINVGDMTTLGDYVAGRKGSQTGIPSARVSFGAGEVSVENTNAATDVGTTYAILHFPGLTIANTALVGNEPYMVTENAANWIIPASGTVSTTTMNNPVPASLVVVPEPSTYAGIFGLAALGLAYLRRRK
jgi:hypothetical protein